MPDNSVAHSKLGRVLAEKGHLDEAAAAWRCASQLKPDDGDAYYNLGTSLIQHGSPRRGAGSAFAGPST